MTYKSTPTPIITFSTCWYNLNSKFPSNNYISWIQNFISIANNFNLVIYTNPESFQQISNIINLSKPNIKIIIKTFEQFYTHKFHQFWISNHINSNLNIHKQTDWKLNMLWNEKVFFVKETIDKQYFNTLYYGWCDIGYFRNRINDTKLSYLTNWPNNQKLHYFLNQNTIHYACVQNNFHIFNNIKQHILYKNYNHIKNPSLEHDFVAGGFFILKPKLIYIFTELYKNKLNDYISNNIIIKDDQSLLNDIILNNPLLFKLHIEKIPYFDNWFLFQRLLL